jgi:hypothetical protein
MPQQPSRRAVDIKRIKYGTNGFELSRQTLFAMQRYYINDYIESVEEFNNDIALIFLDQPSTRPFARLSTQFPKAGAIGRVVGWGFTEASNSVSPLPQYTDMQVLGPLECNYAFFRPDTTICTGSYGTFPNNMTSTTCQGDSGGPMFVPGTNEVLGIVSYAVSNENDDQDCGKWWRVGYMSTGYYLPWLQSKGLNITAVSPSPVLPPAIPPSPTSSPAIPPPTVPKPVLVPPPVLTCPALNGTYTIQSARCGILYISFDTDCKKNRVHLRTMQQVSSRRRRWRLNAAMNRFTAVIAGRPCSNSILASNSAPSLGISGSYWQYKVVPAGSCTAFSLMARRGASSGRYLGVKNDCSGFFWRSTNGGSNARWRINEI